MKNIINSVILAVIFVLIEHCIDKNHLKTHQGKSTNSLPTLDYPNSNNSCFYTRDSLMMIYTLNEWLNKPDKFIDYYNWYFDKFKNRYSDPVFHIDSILYSPDNLKLFAFLIVEHPGKIIDESDREEHYYSKSPETIFQDAMAIVGFRSNISEIWNFYLFRRFIPTSKNNYTGLKYFLRNYYFEKFKYESELIIDTTWKGKGYERLSVRYGYNVNESDFWTKSHFWKRGLRIKGKYNFQTRGNVTPDTPVPLIEEVPIDYPDHLLNLCR